MSKIEAQLKMHYFNSKKSFIIFWSIMFAISALGLTIALYLRSRGHSGNFSTNNISAVIIFCAISSMVAYNETFPCILNMGCTRKDFTIGFMIYNIALSLVLSIIFNILIINEHVIFKAMGFNTNIFGYATNSISLWNMWSNILLHAAFLLIVAALLGLISSIYYLKGMMYLFGIGAVVILLMFFPQVRASAFKALMFIVMTFSREISSYKLILYSLAFSLGCYIIMYLIARISQVKR